MTFWRFYLVPEEDDYDKEYKVYALTNHKKLAKEFMKTRNMKKFIIKKSECTKDEYADAANEYRGAVLEYHKLVTESIDPEDVHKRISHREVEILMTMYEYQSINQDENEYPPFTMSFFSDTFPYILFKDRLLDALRNIEFVSGQRFFDTDGNIAELLEYLENSGLVDRGTEDDFVGYDGEDCDSPNVWIDEVAAFCLTYKHVLI